MAFVARDVFAHFGYVAVCVGVGVPMGVGMLPER